MKCKLCGDEIETGKYCDNCFYIMDSLPMGEDTPVVRVHVGKFLIYLLRWQVSGIVMTPVLVLLMALPLWMAVCIAQFIGALLFYFVDKRIFNVRDNN